jgi:hypothetical protein
MTFGEAILGFVAFGAGVFLYAVITYIVQRRRIPRQREMNFPPQNRPREADSNLATAANRR